MADADSIALSAALEELDFVRADAIVAEAPEADRAALQDQLDTARAVAVEHAEQLAGRIQSMARADHYEGLLDLAEEPTTEPLLGLLSKELRRGATIHLDGARRRQTRFQESATKHMSEAAEALVLLDTGRAKAELDRIDRRWLGADQRAELDTLREQLEAASAERREMDERTAEVLKEHHPSQGSTPRRSQAAGPAPTRRGCGSTIAALAVIASVVGLIL